MTTAEVNRGINNLDESSDTKGGGFLIYKCRSCGALVEKLHVPNVGLALICLTKNIPLPREWGATSVHVVSSHFCTDDKHGMTDLIGGREVTP